MSVFGTIRLRLTGFHGAELRSLSLRNLGRGFWGGDRAGDRVVPPTGRTAHLTLLTAAAMAFLAVFALALSTAAGRLADRWSEGLAHSMTLRLTAPPDEMAAQTRIVLAVLSQTPGVAEAQVLPDDEMAALLEPWFGPDVPVDALPVPRLISITESGERLDAEALRLRLAAEAPGAVLDDHTSWRRPLVAAAGRLRVLGWFSLALIAGASAGMIALAARASMAASGQVVRVLRLVGARDVTIARAFVRRFTRRATAGAALGVVLGMLAVLALPDMRDSGDFLTGLGFHGWGWLAPLLIVPVAAGIGFVATRSAALRVLREVR